MNRTQKEVAVLLAAVAAISFLAIGCNRDEPKSVSERSQAEQGALATRTASPAMTASTPTHAAGAAQDAAVGESTPQGSETEVTPSELLPPDVATSTSELDVTPGSVVEITAEGSTDVVVMSLSDGIGKETAFQFDPGSGTWHASYRVPLRSKSDRVGLSVTAKNAAERWRRVWVFLNVQRGSAGAGAQAEAGADSLLGR